MNFNIDLKNIDLKNISLEDIQAKLKESKQALLPLKKQRETLELKIKKAEKDLVKLGKDLFAFRKGEVVIDSGQSLATFKIKLNKESNVKEEIEEILRRANFNALVKGLQNKCNFFKTIQCLRSQIKDIRHLWGYVWCISSPKN